VITIAARPIKTGLDFFPVDVDMMNDDKIYLLEAQHGIEGFGIYIRLLQRIYRESYYCRWGEKQALIFARKNSVDVETVCAVVKTCLEVGLFCEDLYNQYEVLTSRGVQKRYLNVCSRRKEVRVHKPLLLVEDNEFDNLVYAEETDTEQELMSTETPTESRKNRVSAHKVKESKVKESRGKDTQEKPPPPPSPIKTLEKQTDKTPSKDERQALALLKDIDNWPFDFETDLEKLRELSVDCPDIDILEQVKKYRDYKVDNPLTKKSNPRLQLRNWMEKAQEWAEERNPKQSKNKPTRPYHVRRGG